MLKIGVLGITAVLMALFLKETKPQFTVYISLAACMMIFFYAVSQLSFLKENLENFRQYVNLKDAYVLSMFKIMGITYIADFSANMCKDAGYSAIAGQIEFFGKITILTVSMPIVSALLETISGFLR